MNAFPTLAELPAQMATAVRPLLPGIDRAAYVRFLGAMVHYTRGSGPRLSHAATHAKTPELRAFFARLAQEEGGHHQLAEADLRALGATVPEEPPADVAEFHAAWIGSEEAADWLGALYVLENVAGSLAADVPPHLGRLGLAKTEARFVLTHLVADDEHGAATESHAAAFPEEALLPAARRAAAFWIALHRDAFSDPALRRAATNAFAGSEDT